MKVVLKKAFTVAISKVISKINLRNEDADLLKILHRM